jgi:SAM-dependent methyltransferase
MTGLDHSIYLLDHAKQAERRARVQVDWVRGDMRWLPWREQFDACLNLFTAFGYFEDDAQNEQVLHEVRRVLKPGGRLLLDVSNRDYYLLRLWPKAWRRHGRATILEETNFDPLTGRFSMTFTWAEGDNWHSLTHSVRHYTAPELANMLTRTSKRLIVMAQRP